MLAPVRRRWSELPPSLRALAGVVVIGLAAGVVVLVVFGLGRSTPDTVVVQPTPPLPTEAVTPAPTTAPSSPAPTTPAVDPLLGLDGRFTILLLGSDFRPTNPGNRTDAIMVVSIAPPDGSVSVVSIPRDTARFPLPDGTVFKNKINALYQDTLGRVGRNVGVEFKRIIGSGLGVEIDAYALVGMYGVTQFIDAIGGVDVHLDEPVDDPFYWVNAHTQGVHFPAGTNHLNGPRALIFARTRQGDSDFQRVRRQQQLVQATAQKVLARGVPSLPALLQLADRWVQTDLPLDRALAIYELVAAADVEGARTAVLGPRYARKIPRSVNYELNLDKVRALVADWFAPLPGSPLGPPASAAPAASATPGASSSAAP